MMAIESVATLVSALVIALIILIKTVRRNIQSGRLNHDIDLLATAESRTHSQQDFDRLKHELKSGSIQKRACSSPSFIIQIIFGIAIFAGFAWWANHLWQGAFIELTAASAVLALIGLIMPFEDWSGIKKRNNRLNEIEAKLKKIASSLTEPPVKVQVAGKPETLAVQQPEKNTAEKIPEDSVLRRHYLASQAAEIEARANPYPTDSVLRRHYETMNKAKFEACVQQLSQPKPVVIQQVEKTAVSVPKIPQDSVLRRHILTQLRSEIEASLFPRPTDSVLKRHYEALLESQLENKLAQLN